MRQRHVVAGSSIGLSPDGSHDESLEGIPSEGVTLIQLAELVEYSINLRGKTGNPSLLREVMVRSRWMVVFLNIGIVMEVIW